VCVISASILQDTSVSTFNFNNADLFCSEKYAQFFIFLDKTFLPQNMGMYLLTFKNWSLMHSCMHLMRFVLWE
jgi:hypothetical protein